MENVLHIRHGSSEYDHLEDFDPSLRVHTCCTTLPNSVPDSVSVQFGSAGYECETVRESKQLQQRHSGLDITAISRSDCNIHLQKPDNDTKSQWLTSIPLSCSIPGGLNSSNQLNNTSPRLNVSSLGQGLSQPQNWGFTPYHTLDKKLCNSWPRHQLFQNRQQGLVHSNFHKGKVAHMSPQCSPKHTPYHTPLSSPHRSPQLLRTKCSMSQQTPYVPHPPIIREREVLMKPYIPSSYELGSTFSISSRHSVSNPSSSLCGRPHISYSTGVDGQIFKDKTEVSFFQQGKLPYTMVVFCFRCFLDGLMNSVISKEMCCY